jgi:hypothetical protein
MHRPRAAGNHFPNLRVLPRLKRVQIHGDAPLRQRRLHVAHRGQSPLGFAAVENELTLTFSRAGPGNMAGVFFIERRARRGVQFLIGLPGIFRRRRRQTARKFFNLNGAASPSVPTISSGGQCRPPAVVTWPAFLFIDNAQRAAL